MRCDRVDFEPGGIAYRHTHPGPGIRYLLFGQITIDSEGERAHVRAGRAVVRARAPIRCWRPPRRTSRRRSSACCCCRSSGRASARSATSIPADAEKPKTQRPTVFLEQPVVRAREPQRRRRSSSTSSSCTAPTWRSASRARATSRCSTRCTTRRCGCIVTPPRGRRGEHGRGLRQAHRPPGRLPRHARAGRDATPAAGVHTALAGLDADDPARRPGRARRRAIARASRSSTTGGCSAPVAKWVGADRRRRAGARVRRPRLRGRDLRAGRGRSCSRCPRTCSPTRPTCRTRRPYRRVAAAPGRRASRARWRSCSSGAERPLVDRRRGRLDGAGRGRRRGVRARRSGHPGRRRRSAARTTSTTARRPTRARGHRDGPGARRAHPRRRRAARDRRAPGRDHDRRLHAARPPTPRAAARPRASRPGRARRASTSRSSASLASSSVRGALRASSAPAAAARGAARGGPRRVRAQPARASPSSRARCRWPRHGVRCASGCRPTRSSPTAPATSRSGRTATTSSARYGTQLAPRSGSMGYGVPAAVAAKAVAPGARRRLHRRRRRLPDDRPGARDRGPGASCRSSCSSSTTACTGRSACTRSAATRAASSATDLRNPDFAAYARAFGAHGALVERSEDVRAPRSTRRWPAGVRRSLELRVDPQAITPRGDPGRDPRRGRTMNADGDRRRRRVPVEAVQDALSRIEAQRELRAVITLCGDEALARARSGVRGRLAGVPLLVKDLIDTAGRPHDLRVGDLRRARAGSAPRRRSPRWRRRARSSSARPTPTSSPGACAARTRTTATSSTRGARTASPAARAAATRRRSPPGWCRSRSAPTPAGRCGCRPARAGSSGSSRRSARCPSRASSRWRRASTRSGRWRAPSPTARSRTRCSPARRSPSRGLRGLRVGVLTAPPDRAGAPRGAARRARARRTRSACARSAPTCGEVAPAGRRRPTRGRSSTPRRRGRTPRRTPPPRRVRADGPGEARRRAAGSTARTAGRACAALRAWRARGRARARTSTCSLSPTLGVEELPRAGVDELEVRLAFSAYTRRSATSDGPPIAIGGLQLAGRDVATVIAAALALEYQGNW